MDTFTLALVFSLVLTALLLLSYLFQKSAVRSAKSHLETQLQVAEARLKAREDSEADLRTRLQEMEKRAQEGQYYQAQALEREKQVRQKTEEHSSLQNRYTEMEARARASQELLTKERELLTQNYQRMQADFQVLAQKILEDNSKKFSEHHQEKLSHLLAPLSKDLTDFRKKVEETHQEETKQLAGLQSTVLLLRDMNQKISQDAQELTKALKGESKTQGTWGEMILERVLEISGLRKGIEYETQTSFTQEDQKRQMPDAIIRLPGEKDVIVDSKVSLVAYEQWSRADSEETRILAQKRLALSLQNHVNGLSAKNYQLIPGLRSLDYVLLFIPLEGAFPVVMAAWPGLLEECFAKNIIPVTPTTLLATLRTIENSWRFERQSQNVQEIFQAAGALYDKLAAFTEDMDRIGRQLETLRGTYQEATARFSSGSGNVIRRAQKLRELGAKTSKQIAPSWIGDDE